MAVPLGPGADFETAQDYCPPCPAAYGAPYEAMLEFLTRGRWLEGLPLDRDGILQVGVPFCACFHEYALLSAFLARQVLGRPGVAGVSILGTEVASRWEEAGFWRRKEKYVARKHPGMKLELRRMDLAAEPLPGCGLALAIHPEATTGGPWPRILANVARSAGGGGLCVVATFFEAEIDAVVRICRSMGIEPQVHENPFWRIHAPPPSAYVRFLALFRGGGAADAHWRATS